MTKMQQHRDLTRMLFVARALPGGLPWTIREDRELIHKARVLWASLTPVEQAEEHRALLDLWEKKGDERVIQANPQWGPWAVNLGEVVIPDQAFGPAKEEFRPELMGPPNPDDYPGFIQVAQWLFKHGFRTTRLSFASISRHHRFGVLHMPVPDHRIHKEADRLFTLLVREFPHLKFVPQDWSGDGISITASYDAVMGSAYLFLQGFSDDLLEPKLGTQII